MMFGDVAVGCHNAPPLPFSTIMTSSAGQDSEHTTVPDQDSNPWNDDSRQSTPTVKEPLRTPDPALFANVFSSPDSASINLSLPSKELLSEFDPFVSPEENAAREAWQTSEGHPPPPPSPPTPTSPSKDVTPPNSAQLAPTPLPTPPPRSSSPFPSFASLAKTFSIPVLSRARPMSMDVARAVPSPTTLSSIAGQNSIDFVIDSNPDTSSMPSPPSSAGRNGGEEAHFDFQKFLDQMKTRSAEPVSKYLRSFLSNFSKRLFTVSDQVTIIADFLNFIAVQMRNSEVWKNASDAEFDNALEGIEKLVMNRLYDFTFTPQVARTVPPRPINPDDLERDRVLSQRISLFGWVEEKHLDVPVGEGSQGFIMFAQQELLKINHYKAPRDKLICVLNCCKVIFGLIRHLRTDEGADSFVPVLIFVVLKANPQHLFSNVEFINRFRNPAKLQGEAGYYLSSLIGAISFIETMDHTSLSSIDKEEFERNVETAIQALPPSEPQSPILSRTNSVLYVTPDDSGLSSPHAGEESAQPLSLSAAIASQSIGEDARRLLQKTGDTISKPLSAISRIFSEALDGAENKLSYLPGPFAPFELGREQRDPVGDQQHPPSPYTPQTPSSAGSAGVYAHVVQTPYKPRVRRGQSPSLPSTPGTPPPSGGYSTDDTPSRNPRYVPATNQPLPLGPSQPYMTQQFPQGSPYGPQHQYLYNHTEPPLPARVQSLVVTEGGSGPGGGTGGALLGPDASHISRTPTPSLDLTGVQAQIDASHANAAAAARETLIQIFPTTDVEVIEWVLEANGGDLGKSIEGLLEMSSGS
ncbi:hypothetical protein AX17_001764 [Amanita inopinata Kibby_2008]|nr:hypothetical protein AX17_001764 [Amanita inopinata Kibby_2008]